MSGVKRGMSGRQQVGLTQLGVLTAAPLAVAVLWTVSQGQLQIWEFLFEDGFSQQNTECSKQKLKPTKWLPLSPDVQSWSCC